MNLNDENTKQSMSHPVPFTIPFQPFHSSQSSESTNDSITKNRRMKHTPSSSISLNVNGMNIYDKSKSTQKTIKSTRIKYKSTINYNTINTFNIEMTMIGKNGNERIDSEIDWIGSESMDRSFNQSNIAQFTIETNNQFDNTIRSIRSIRILKNNRFSIQSQFWLI